MRFIYLFSSFVLLLLSVSVGQAASPGPGWQAGHLTWWDGTVLAGDLAYNWQAEMVLLRETDGRIRTFSAGQVRQFGWSASAGQKARYFIALPGSNNQLPDRPAFFEVCAEGTMTVVRRMKQTHGLFRRPYANPVRGFDPETPDPHDSFFDYFAHIDGQFLPFRRFYTAIYLARMSAHRRELQQYIQVHRLNEKSQFGQLRIIEQYNRLAEQPMASVRTPPIH